MEALLLDILDQLRRNPDFGAKGLSRLIREHSAALSGDMRFAKKQILPYYLRVKSDDPDRWRQWGVDAELERRLMALVQMKPRRSASGVATITVITKPWPCASNCRYCPSDLRMPKSYRNNEPACQRAERCWFDPFLQVNARLKALTQMGHPTDKVELIVLGGTWSDYPSEYRLWFAHELFRALNLADEKRESEAELRERRYTELGEANDPDVLAGQVEDLQQQVDAGVLSYNQALRKLAHKKANAVPATCASALLEHHVSWQHSTFEELEREQRLNEDGGHRCVGLVVETRPDVITPEALRELRLMGCTKLQMGVQSLDPKILRANERGLDVASIRQAFGLLRLFGFKTHAHFMLNLLGATPATDRQGYHEFATGSAYSPDEVKLYPCALIDGTALCQDYRAGRWRPYEEDELVELLCDCVLSSPPWLRISRMIRDFSSGDIVAGNRKTNLRQLVEDRLAREGREVREIRYREISTQEHAVGELALEELWYETVDTNECFLQWVDDAGRIAGFLRLSLPYDTAVQDLGSQAPVGLREAMIREVHVYGRAARLNEVAPAQHRGLGKQLVARAEDLARDAGYTKINVISAVGTRNYYRRLGYVDTALYLQKPLENS